mmetsp:Transcript_9436/g.14929  ORF Transcript_9436/g.14929 Transcript_9436/m.14929 type:complete len:121 (-) Transcript_9436:31-393(-)
MAGKDMPSRQPRGMWRHGGAYMDRGMYVASRELWIQGHCMKAGPYKKGLNGMQLFSSTPILSKPLQWKLPPMSTCLSRGPFLSRSSSSKSSLFFVSLAIMSKMNLSIVDIRDIYIELSTL